MDKQVEKDIASKSYNITNINLILIEKDRIIKDLKLKKQQLDREIREHDEHFLQATRTIQGLLDEKNEQIARHQSKLEELKLNSELVKGQLSEGYKQQLQDISKKQESDLTKTDTQVISLSEDLHKLQHFKNTYSQNQALLDAEKKRSHDLKRELERVRVEGKNEQEALKKRIEDRFQRQIEEYHKKAQSDAERNISDIERNIQMQNNLLEGHADLQQDEIVHTEGVAQKLASENEQYQYDVKLKQQAIEEYAKKQYEQNNKIKMLKSKIELLEKRLSEIVANFEKEKELLRFQSEQVIKEQAEDIRGLRESIRLKTRELKNLKALCQMILDQRSDIEQFFLEALEQVKEEKRRKILAQTAMTAQAMPGAGTQQFLPLIDPKSKFSKQGNFEKQQSTSIAEAQKQQLVAQQVELSDLDWEDRERVLRLMFSKMNSGQPPTNWRLIEGAGTSSGGRRTENGVSSTGRGELNRSFRQTGGLDGEGDEDDDGYDQEIDEDDEGEDEDYNSEQQRR